MTRIRAGGASFRTSSTTYVQLGGPVTPYNELRGAVEFAAATVRLPPTMNGDGTNSPRLLVPAMPNRRSVTILATANGLLRVAPTREALVDNGGGIQLKHAGDSLTLYTTAAVYAAHDELPDKGALPVPFFVELEASPMAEHTGAAEWQGGTRVIVAAVGTVPAIIPVVGRQTNRRSVSIINLDTTRSVRIGRTEQELSDVAGGVTLPANSYVVVNTVAPFYVANDDTAASIKVAFIVELDA